MRKKHLDPLIAIKRAMVMALLLLGACSYLGQPTPETFNERAAAAYASVTAVRQTALTLLQTGSITAADAQNVQEGADNVRAGIDVARNIAVTNPGQAENRLTAAIAALNALNAYLASQQ